MSDYLGNLVARTVSPVASVRPQLPSIFEPSPGSRQPKSEFDLEQEVFTEPPPLTQNVGKTFPTPPTIEFRIPPSETRPGISAKPSDSTEDRGEKIARAPVAKNVLFEQPDSVPEQGAKNSAKKNRLERNFEPFASEPREFDSHDPQIETNQRSSRGGQTQTSESRSKILEAKSKSERSVTPVSAIQKNRAVQAVIPAIRALPQNPSSQNPPPEPTINVTIGRVEIRATSPPARPRAQPKPASVLSLEDYLRQRANGGRR